MPREIPSGVDLLLDDAVPLAAQNVDMFKDLPSGVDMLLGVGEQEQQEQRSEPQRSDFGIDFTADRKAVRQQIKALPKNARKEALQQWADVFVANKRKDGGILQDIDDTVRSFSRGTPIGSFLDEANAATLSVFSDSTSSEEKAIQNATDRA